VILPLALFVNLAAACAPQVAPQTLAAIAQTESRLDPLAIGDNTAHRSYRPQSKADAIALARRLIAAGHNLDLGIMQINQTNMNWLGLTLDRAFDPCHSLWAGATVLTAFSRYHTGDPRKGFRDGYVARIVRASLRMPAIPRAVAQIEAHANPFARPARWPSEMSFNAPR
jgi:type IV secretion system protein VirB1